MAAVASVSAAFSAGSPAKSSTGWASRSTDAASVLAAGVAVVVGLVLVEVEVGVVVDVDVDVDVDVVVDVGDVGNTSGFWPNARRAAP